MNQVGLTIIKQKYKGKKKRKTKKKQSGEGETIICCRVRWHVLLDGPDFKDYHRGVNIKSNIKKTIMLEESFTLLEPKSNGKCLLWHIRSFSIWDERRPHSLSWNIIFIVKPLSITWFSYLHKPELEDQTPY